MPYDFTLGAGDRPTASFTCKDGKGNLVPFSNFTGASLTFRLFPGVGQTPLITAAGTITLNSDGKLGTVQLRFFGTGRNHTGGVVSR